MGEGAERSKNLGGRCLAEFTLSEVEGLSMTVFAMD